ncbi:Vesicle-mediated ER to Golgi transport protein [Coemansia sp. RSA 2050]|nr:Vesicle-mediated ER to Golgi transport protein [Coemansia sp. RSA 2050]KAJ2731439.1 Vesicle-mediated ER to Golgi transport protein [Coemansia sp. BCRC 34962]
MDFFKRYGAIGGSQPQSPAETIQRMADRAETSTLLEDKRAAVLGLKGLSREYKKDVGEVALDTLLKVLKEDSEDHNLLKAILETLNNLCARDSPGGELLEGATMADPVADKFSQAILHDSDDVISTFLGLLGDADFYVRYYTVQLLSALHTCAGEELQQRVLVSPTGVGRLVDLLSDQRDIIRNEGIQLLIAMTKRNADIQKIVAFENAFDYLLGIVDEEGGVRGNIIVQDCLQLLHNLLNYNVSNQNFFRETSGIQRLPSLLVTDPSQTAAGRSGHPIPDGDEDLEWTSQHALNMLVVLDIVRMLIQPGNTNTQSNQSAMQQCGVIPPLLQLALAYEAPLNVRAQALYAIGDVIRAHQANQNLFQRILITTAVEDDSDPSSQRAIPEPAIVIVIRLAVGKHPATVSANEYYIVRAAATHLVQAYVGGNTDAQLALAATLTPPGDIGTITEPEQHQSAGSLIVSVLLDWRETSKEDVWRVWYAALLLSTILRDHNECKEQALKITLGDASKGEEPFPLINELMSQARQATQHGADVRVSLAILTLISVWLVNFPKGVSVFLDESANISFLVEQISGSSGINALVQGVAAFMLGIVYQFDVDPESPMSRESLYPIISKRVGADQLLIRVQRLRDSKEFQYAVGLAAGAYSSAYSVALAEVYFDSVFADLFKMHYESFRAAVRLGPNEAMANPSYAYLHGGMAGYAVSAASGSTPGTPRLGGATTVSRAASPSGSTAGGVPDPAPNSRAPAEQTVAKSEFDALHAKFTEQESQIAELKHALEVSIAQAQATMDLSKQASDDGIRLEEEKQQRALVEAERDEQAHEITRLRAQLDDAQKQLAANQDNPTDTSDAARVAKLEQQLEALKLEGSQHEANWQSQRDELQKKLANAEKQVVKAAAAGRNTNKKKEQQQATELIALENDIKAKDKQIAKLTAQVAELSEKASQLGLVDELKERLAGLEKEQEDLLVYLADQEQQAKESRAKLRGYGEAIPLSDDEDGEDDEDDEE